MVSHSPLSGHHPRPVCPHSDHQGQSPPPPSLCPSAFPLLNPFQTRGVRWPADGVWTVSTCPCWTDVPRLSQPHKEPWLSVTQKRVFGHFLFLFHAVIIKQS